jgi:hypothetical protein
MKKTTMFLRKIPLTFIGLHGVVFQKTRRGKFGSKLLHMTSLGITKTLATSKIWACDTEQCVISFDVSLRLRLPLAITNDGTLSLPSTQFSTLSTCHAETTPMASHWSSKPEVVHNSSKRLRRLCFCDLFVCYRLQLVCWRQTTRIFNDVQNVNSTEHLPCGDLTFSVYEGEVTVSAEHHGPNMFG